MNSPTTLINGVWSDSDTRLDVHNPVDGKVVGSIGYSDAGQAFAAAEAAAAALPGWAGAPARSRSDVLLAAAKRIEDRIEELGVTLAREAGKRLPEAVAEMRFSAEYFRWFAEEGRRRAGSIIPNEAADRRHLTIRRPVGVVASLTPWNFPCSIQARKLAPALAAGCTVVARVSEKAPLAATEMIRCVTEAGLPAGVLNLVHGPAAEISNAYLEHPAVRAVSFTGSTPVGRSIMAKASERVVRPLLELGGDAAFVVFDDADLDAAVEGAMVAKFRNTGQSCIAANRFFVHDRVFDEFVGRFVERVDAITMGDGLRTPTPDLSACIDAQRAQAVHELVDDALKSGATKVTRDFAPVGETFSPPALLVDVPVDCRLNREEVFGPVAAINRFTDEDEVIGLANDTEMGLAGYFYSENLSRLWRVIENLDVGIIAVNNALPSVAFAPMGGTRQSGLGREGGHPGIEEFEEVRYVSIGV